MRRAIIAVGVLVGLVGVAWAWLWGASLLFLAMTKLTGQVEPAWLAWWIYFNIDNQTKWTKLCLVGSAAVPTILLLSAVAVVGRLIYIRGTRRRSAPKGGGIVPIERGVSDNHGHAEWLDHRHAHTVFTGPRQPYGGIFVGIDNEGYPLIDPCDRQGWSGHSMQIAGSGAYKTASAISSAVAWRGTSVILDPSCELAPMLANSMRDSGKRVEILNLSRPDGAERWGLNVLDWIDVKHPEAVSQVRAVVGWVCRDEEGSKPSDSLNPVFPSGGRDLITCLLCHLLWDDSETGPVKTLDTLRWGICQPVSDLRATLNTIYQTSNSITARQLAGSLKDIVKDTFDGIYFNATQSCAWLSDPAFAGVVSGDGFRTADLIDPNQRMTVFLQIPQRVMLETKPLARVMVGALLNAVMLSDGRNAGNKILFLLDEVAQLGKMKVLETASVMGRKYGIVLHLLWQSKARMEEIWTRDGAIAWFEAMSWYSFSAVQTLTTAKEISEMVGKLAVKAYSEGENQGLSASWQPGRGSRNRGKQLNEHEISRSLILPTEVLTDMPLDEMVVFARGQRPLRIKKAVWFRLPQIACRVEKNKFVPEGVT